MPPIISISFQCMVAGNEGIDLEKINIIMIIMNSNPNAYLQLKYVVKIPLIKGPTINPREDIEAIKPKAIALFLPE
jgi:hypothetical protein